MTYLLVLCVGFALGWVLAKAHGSLEEIIATARVSEDSATWETFGEITEADMQRFTNELREAGAK